MGRLNLVLADSDTEYLAKFEKYLIVNYPQRFEMISFASSEKLAGFLNHTCNADILLINGTMFKNELKLMNGGITLILTGDDPMPAPEGFDSVEKYQHADRLVSDILRLYAARGPKGCTITGRSRSRIACVCSPSGGTGKSSIAAGCCILGEGRGLRSFYLNLEGVPSTAAFFKADSGQSFSNVIYHLKGRSGNLGLKLEAAASMDTKTGVHYFGPPDNILEMNELTDQDVALLLGEFKKSAVYNTVFVDTSGGLSPINAAAMKESDVIIMVLAPGSCSSVKYEKFRNGLKALEHKTSAELTGRIVPVINRIAAGRRGFSDSGLFGEYGSPLEVNECPCPGPDGFPSDLTDSVSFLSSLNGILEYAEPGKSDLSAPHGGGENIA